MEGVPPEALVGRHVLDLYADVPGGRARARELRRRFLAGAPIDGEVVAYRADDGRIVWGQLWVHALADDAGRGVESRSLVIDLTAQREAERAECQQRRRFRRAFLDAPIGAALLTEDTTMVEVNHALARLVGQPRSALRDPLTGLLNRRGLLERSEGILAAADRHGREVAALFCDVDGFKAINDRDGHAAGDAALVAIAEALRTRLRAEDQLGRWGGDEFCALLDGTGAAEAEAVATSLQCRLGPADATLPRLSVGWAVRAPGSSRSVGELVDEADATMKARRGARRH
ncbi:MAG: sensor domain-containing diguanylate cyclase [Egibacteraceae bacterium]